jgi:F-type H+-transporting ATPase subunit b
MLRNALSRMLSNENFWVLVSFVLFVGVAIYFGLHKMIAKVLDERSDRIKRELDEARRLRNDAQALLAEYQRKQRQALDDTQAIVTRAEREARRLVASAEADLNADIARRTQLAQAKIAQAQAQAIKDVRDATIDAAMLAAEKVLRERLQGAEAYAALDRAMSELRVKLH